jgi:hypothetical protein
MSDTQQSISPLHSEPLIIYATREFDGFTYQLDPSSQRRARQQLGNQAKTFPRIFISYEVKENLDKLVGPVASELVLLLTGLSEEDVGRLGGVEFRDPNTDEALFFWQGA